MSPAGHQRALKGACDEFRVKESAAHGSHSLLVVRPRETAHSTGEGGAHSESRRDPKGSAHLRLLSTLSGLSAVGHSDEPAFKPPGQSFQAV